MSRSAASVMIFPRPFHVLANAKPYRTGRHLSPARGPARPFSSCRSTSIILIARRSGVSFWRRRVRARCAPWPYSAPRICMNAQRLARRLPVGESVVEAILDLVRAARPGEGESSVTEHLLWGPGPRASQALIFAARARAIDTRGASRPRSTMSPLWPRRVLKTSHGPHLHGPRRRRHHSRSRAPAHGAARRMRPL